MGERAIRRINDRPRKLSGENELSEPVFLQQAGGIQNLFTKYKAALHKQCFYKKSGTQSEILCF